MRKAKIELGGRRAEKKIVKDTDKKLSDSESKQNVDASEGKMADLSHIYNHRMLDVYDLYFKEDELYVNKDEHLDAIRKVVAIYMIKNYHFEIDSELWDILEIEIYSHDDPYLGLIAQDFKNYENGGPKPECLVFWFESTHPKTKGNFLIMLTGIKLEKEVVVGRKNVYEKVQGCIFEIKPPNPDKIKDYVYDFDEHIYRAPRESLSLIPFKHDSHQLNKASKNIMKPRSYSFDPQYVSEQRKILYAYQSMRNNEGESRVAKDLKIKPLKLAAWLRRFFEIPEVSDPYFFLREDFNWSNFDDYLKAFKYFTNLV